MKRITTEYFSQQLNDKSFLREISLIDSDVDLINDLFEISEINSVELYVMLIAAISSLNRGSSSLLLKSDFTYMIMEKLNYKSINFDLIIQQIIVGEYSSLISSDTVKNIPCYLIKCFDGYYIYFQMYYKNELILKELITKRISSDNFIDLQESLFIKLNYFFSKKDFLNLNDSQRMALILSLLKNFIVITGGPGSGKTTTIASIVSFFAENVYSLSDIAVIAPTGKAAFLLTTSINNKLETTKEFSASTIHRLLQYSSYTKGFKYNPDNLLPYKLIIVDESSMIDVILMGSLLNAIDNDCKLILVGDSDQLPSVDAGNVFYGFVPDKTDINYSTEVLDVFKKLGIDTAYFTEQKNSFLKDRVVFLKGNNRSKNENIMNIADSINSMDHTCIELIEVQSIDNLLFRSNSIALIKPDINYKSSIDSFIEKYFIHYFIDSGMIDMISNIKNHIENNSVSDDYISRLLQVYDRMRILCYTREGYCGIEYINNKLLNLFLNKSIYKNRSGIPVIISTNNYNYNVFNGDNGIIITDNNGKDYICVKRDNQIIRIAISEIRQFDYGFAITVHKSQGSGFDDIILILPAKDFNLNTKEMLYTAVTRAINKVFIFGDNEILRTGITRRIERFSGLDIAEYNTH